MLISVVMVFKKRDSHNMITGSNHIIETATFLIEASGDLTNLNRQIKSAVREAVQTHYLDSAVWLEYDLYTISHSIR